MAVLSNHSISIVTISTTFTVVSGSLVDAFGADSGKGVTATRNLRIYVTITLAGFAVVTSYRWISIVTVCALVALESRVALVADACQLAIFIEGAFRCEAVRRGSQRTFTKLAVVWGSCGTVAIVTLDAGLTAIA